MAKNRKVAPDRKKERVIINWAVNDREGNGHKKRARDMGEEESEREDDHSNAKVTFWRALIWLKLIWVPTIKADGLRCCYRRGT